MVSTRNFFYIFFGKLPVGGFIVKFINIVSQKEVIKNPCGISSLNAK